MSAAVKRAFLHRAFHPIGNHACAMSGMIDASPDVEIAEFQATQVALNAIPDEVIERALERASWVSDVISSDAWGGVLDTARTTGNGVGVCPDCGEPCSIVTLQEILVKFYIAMRLEDAHGQLVR